MADNTKPRPAPTAIMAYLSERTSERGRRYFVGWGGLCKFLLYKTDLVDKFGNRVWTLNVQQCEPKAGTFHKAVDEGAPPEAPPPAAQADFDDPIGF